MSERVFVRRHLVHLRSFARQHQLYEEAVEFRERLGEGPYLVVLVDNRKNKNGVYINSEITVVSNKDAKLVLIPRSFLIHDKDVRSEKDKFALSA